MMYADRLAFLPLPGLLQLASLWILHTPYRRAFFPYQRGLQDKSCDEEGRWRACLRPSVLLATGPELVGLMGTLPASLGSSATLSSCYFCSLHTNIETHFSALKGRGYMLLLLQCVLNHLERQAACDEEFFFCRLNLNCLINACSAL